MDGIKFFHIMNVFFTVKSWTTFWEIFFLFLFVFKFSTVKFFDRREFKKEQFYRKNLSDRKREINNDLVHRFQNYHNYSNRKFLFYMSYNVFNTDMVHRTWTFTCTLMIRFQYLFFWKRHSLYVPSTKLI